jgi:hypothetical protein
VQQAGSKQEEREKQKVHFLFLRGAPATAACPYLAAKLCAVNLT